jgi:hypothetical protein
MKEKNLQFQLSSEMIEDIHTYSTILNKDINTILHEALKQYFENEQEKLLASKKLETDNSMTNLDFNEFWDDVEI